MAYQTGTATGIADLLDKLATFAVAAGWTLNRRDASSLSLSKGAIYQNYFDNSSEIQMSASTGYNSGSAWSAQPGASGNVHKSRQMAGSFAAYHFFADANYLHVVVEVDPGLFRHLAAGELAKPSGYTGGHYSGCVGFSDAGVHYNTLFVNKLAYGNGNYPEGPVVRCDFESQTGFVQFATSGVAGRLRGVSTDHANLTMMSDFALYADIFQYCTPNTLNGVTPFAPVHIFVQRTGGMLSPIGYVRDLRIVNITNYNGGDVETLGANDWLIFPASVKGAGLYGLGNYGYAYKKVP